MEEYLNRLETFIKGQHADNALNVIEGEVYADRVVDVMEEMILLASRAKDLTKADLSISGEGSDKRDNMTNNWEKFLDSLDNTVSKFQRIMERDSENERQFAQLINSITKSLQDVKNLQRSLLDTEDSSTCIPLNNLKTPVNLLLLKVFPSLVGLKESSDKVNHVVKTRYYDLWFEAYKICDRCREHSQTLAVLLIGGLLSFKRPDWRTWCSVDNDLHAKKDLEDIFFYCIKDLPPSLEYCYLYLACYPMGHEIPTESITKIWIAEGFIEPEEGETREDTTHKYLEELAQSDRHKLFEWHIYNTLAVLLIGGLLSLKRPDRRIWGSVDHDLQAKKDLEDIISYCIKDLRLSLKDCYLYLASSPMGYEIPTESITKIWIAEGFIEPEEGETREDTAHKYLEELAQRSLIWVSKRSISGAIKYFRVFRTIQNYLVKYSKREYVMAVNPEKVERGSLRRVAINKDEKYQYPKVKSFRMRSFLAFDIDINVLISARFLRVLELRKSVVQETVLERMVKLRYLGLRDCNISELPKNIGNMKDLQTLDVRDTKIETLPKSLWNISALRHVYVNHGPRIEGPPPTANIPNLQTLKTVRVPHSWEENVPNLSINLRKLALSYVSYLKLETFSNPLSRMVDPISIAMMGPIVHAELVDTRAFPNLNTLKSIKLVGKWNFQKLSIDNVGFPSNLAKLILSNSHLREDPMPRLERLQALKLLRLEDGAYTGDKMVCSANGFPQLQFLQLSQLHLVWMESRGREGMERK